MKTQNLISILFVHNDADLGNDVFEKNRTHAVWLSMPPFLEELSHVLNRRKRIVLVLRHRLIEGFHMSCDIIGKGARLEGKQALDFAVQACIQSIKCLDGQGNITMFSTEFHTECYGEINEEANEKQKYGRLRRVREFDSKEWNLCHTEMSD